MAGADADMVLSMIPKREIALPLILISLAIGMLVGAVGSAISVRRHIKV